MKRIAFLIVMLCIVMIAQSQNTVVTTKGDLLEGKIESFINKTLSFTDKIDVINSKSIEIDQVLEIHGPLPEFRKNAILKKNPNVKFFNKPLDPSQRRIHFCIRIETSGKSLKTNGLNFA